MHLVISALVILLSLTPHGVRSEVKRDTARLPPTTRCSQPSAPRTPPPAVLLFDAPPQSGLLRR